MEQGEGLEDDVPISPPSKLFGGLVVDWADGSLSAAKLQLQGARGLGDGFEHPIISRLASMGADRHAHESLMNLLLNRCGVAAMLNTYPGEAVDHMVLPSTWIKHLATYPQKFSQLLGANRPGLRSFWKNALARPGFTTSLRDHPAVGTKTLAQLVNVVPLTVHTDAAPYTKTQSCVTISFSGLLGAGDTKLKKFPVASFIKVTDSTEGQHAAWRRICADFEALAGGQVNGETVAQHADGAPLQFALLFAKADEDARSNEFGLTHYSGRNEMCSECLAGREERVWTNLLVDAGWRPSERMPLVAYKVQYFWGNCLSCLLFYVVCVVL